MGGVAYADDGNTSEGYVGPIHHWVNHYVHDRCYQHRCDLLIHAMLSATCMRIVASYIAAFAIATKYSLITTSTTW